MGLPLLFPLSSDPLDKIPPERLALWPLLRWHRIGLRAASLAFSPITWLVAIYAVRTGTGVFALLLLLGSVLVATRIPGLNFVGRVPLLRGRLGGLITNNLREMLSVLDTWLAILLSVVGTAWRLTGARADPEALPIFGMLIALALSTQTQSLFGLDSGSGENLYRILPLSRREILFAKDVAWLAVLVVLIAPLSVMAGLTFGLAALAIGHHSSVTLRLPQKRWRFAGGRLLPGGALQVVVSVGLGFIEMRWCVGAFFAAAALYGISLWFYGRPYQAISDGKNSEIRS